MAAQSLPAPNIREWSQHCEEPGELSFLLTPLW